MPTRNIDLTDHHNRLIESEVDSGRYENASEVVRAGLRLLEQQEALDALKLERLRAAVDEGFVPGNRRRVIALDAVDSYVRGLGERVG